jgi:UDP-glucose 4-epimerase
MAAIDRGSDIVLVTGSSGFIGQPVIRSLAPRFRMIGFDREGWPNPPKEAECVCVDLTSDESVQAAFERVRYAYGNQIASVIHLAEYYDFSGEPSPLYDQITVQGTGRLLRALRQFDVWQFMFSSTMLVHAPCEPGERIAEEWPLDPKWDYPRSKVATETLIRRERGDIHAVSLRHRWRVRRRVPLGTARESDATHLRSHAHQQGLSGRYFAGSVICSSR